jgi:DNA-directed RNA polymerase specialized sigma24 family protein
MQHITVERVQLAVGKLNANQEDVMQLRLQGYTYDEIGEVMHTNGNAAKSTIMRANANLRVYLQDMAA